MSVRTFDFPIHKVKLIKKLHKIHQWRNLLQLSRNLSGFDKLRLMTNWRSSNQTTALLSNHPRIQGKRHGTKNCWAPKLGISIWPLSFYYLRGLNQQTFPSLPCFEAGILLLVLNVEETFDLSLSTWNNFLSDTLSISLWKNDDKFYITQINWLLAHIFNLNNYKLSANQYASFLVHQKIIAMLLGCIIYDTPNSIIWPKNTTLQWY